MSVILQPPMNFISPDLAHAALLMGVVASLKPLRVLELGFGHGYTADAILQALEWNSKGRLTIVDNWLDWGGTEPHSTQVFRDRGVEFISSDEEDFVRNAPSAYYDLLVSDADHQNSQRWLEDHLRVTRHEGFLFFHDVGTGTLFPNLRQIVADIRIKRMPYYLFESSSRAGELCERGWLMVINRVS